jgi:hypothetical protein
VPLGHEQYMSCYKGSYASAKLFLSPNFPRSFKSLP